MTQLDFRLPDVGEGLTEAEIVEWLVAPGSEVRADQPVVTVETAKAQVDLPAPTDGVIRALGYGTGDVVAVGATLFVLDTDNTTDTDTATDAQPTAGDSTSQVQSSPTPSSTNGRRRHGVRAAPSTRRLAEEHGIDLVDLTGSGPGGRIVASDIERAVAATSGRNQDATSRRDSGADEVRPLRGLRRQVARAMTETASIPHITEFREVDATELERAHQVLRAQVPGSGRLTLLTLLIRIVGAALRRHPDLNATFDMAAEEVTVHRDIDISIAVATVDGLMVPVLRRADERSLPSLRREIARLSEGARARGLPIADTRGGTVTVSNFGSYGSWLGTPLINPPQVAIVGFGRTRDAVVAVDGAPAVRRVLPVVAAADHRVIDGETLGGFLATAESLIRNPLLLLADPSPPQQRSDHVKQ